MLILGLALRETLGDTGVSQRDDKRPPLGSDTGQGAHGAWASAGENEMGRAPKPALGKGKKRETDWWARDVYRIRARGRGHGWDWATWAERASRGGDSAASPFSFF
jgi:hypothetical protein